MGFIIFLYFYQLQLTLNIIILVPGVQHGS